MGKLLVDALRSRVEVVTVNRGNSYWGSSSSPTVKANRRHRERYRDSISELINTQKRTWLGVVDFCGYSPRDIQESLPEILFDSEIFRYTFSFPPTRSTRYPQTLLGKACSDLSMKTVQDCRTLPYSTGTRTGTKN